MKTDEKTRKTKIFDDNKKKVRILRAQVNQTVLQAVLEFS